MRWCRPPVKSCRRVWWFGDEVDPSCFRKKATSQSDCYVCEHENFLLFTPLLGLVPVAPLPLLLFFSQELSIFFVLCNSLLLSKNNSCHLLTDLVVTIFSCPWHVVAYQFSVDNALRQCPWTTRIKTETSSTTASVTCWLFNCLMSRMIVTQEELLIGCDVVVCYVDLMICLLLREHLWQECCND